MLGLGQTRFLYFCLRTNKRPTVLALSETTCEQVAVSPETAMGCRKLGFYEQKKDITVALAFIDYKYKSQSLTFTYLALQLDKQTVPCATLYWEFTAKLLSCSDLYLSDI